MKAIPTSGETREVLAAARRYRRAGYAVHKPGDPHGVPDFLGDLAPDFIAERPDDKVVVEIKRANAVPGSNDLVEIADRVASQPGWRFELIALSDASTITQPDLARSTDEVRRLLDQGFAAPAFVFAYAVLENLLAHAALREGINPADATPAGLVRDLVVRGVLDEQSRQDIADARTRRNTLAHDPGALPPAVAEVEALLALALHVQSEVRAAAPSP